jgi:hypothetical protein
MKSHFATFVAPFKINALKWHRSPHQALRQLANKTNAPSQLIRARSRLPSLRNDPCQQSLNPSNKYSKKRFQSRQNRARLHALNKSRQSPKVMSQSRKRLKRVARQVQHWKGKSRLKRQVRLLAGRAKLDSFL